MKIVERLEDGVPVGSVSGDIDLETSPKLREFLKNYAAHRTPKLILDLAEVAYIDSSGLATLVEYFKMAHDFQGKLALTSLTPRVRNAFEIVGLHQIFSLYPDVPAALVALA